MDLDNDSLRRSLVKASLAGRSWDHSGMATMARLAMIVKLHQQEKADQLVKDNKHRAVLHHYESDATSYLTDYRRRVYGGGQSGTDRRGKQLSEFLCERSFYLTLAHDGEPSGAVVVVQPRSLSEGTTAEHEYSCACAAFETLKEMGHQGISIAHYCFDRAKLSANADLLVARHELWAGRHRAGGGEPKQPLMDWVVRSGCALHDGSKSLQWSLSTWVYDKAQLKDMYIVIESCRNSYDLLDKFMPQFLAKHMVAVDTPYDRGEVAAWWRCMGAGADWVDRLVDINPWWHMGQLRVSKTVEGKAVSGDQVAEVLLYIFKFRTFVETRWCTVGHSCRGLVGALSVGLYELALLALDLKGSVDTKLHGIKKITADIKWYAAVGSIATFVPDAFCASVSEDDRLCRRLHELEQVVEDELEFAFRISDFVWKRLALAAKSALWAMDMKNACLTAVHKSVAFLAHRVFSTARSLPWSLCEGDIDANVKALADSGDHQDDPVAIKIIRLLDQGACDFRNINKPYPPLAVTQ